MPQTKEQNSKSQEISFLDILMVLTKRMRFILLFTIITAGLFAFCVFLFKLLPADSPINIMPDYYQPSALVQLKDLNSDSLSSSASSLSSVASLLGGSTSSTDNPLVAAAEAILGTSNFLDEIIMRNKFTELEKSGFDKMTEKQKASFLKGLRPTIQKDISFKYDEKTKFIEISYKNINSQLAYDVLQSIMELLRTRLIEISNKTIIEKKSYLSEKILIAKENTNKAVQFLIEYQKANDAYTGTAASDVLVRRIISLDNEIVTKKQSLELMKAYSAANSPELKMLQTEINSLEAFKASEESKLSDGSSPKLLQSVQYIRLQKDIELSQTLLSLYSAEFAKAEIEENAQNTSFITIQGPTVLLLKSGPSRGKIVVIGAIVFFLLSIFTAFLLDYFSQCIENAEEGIKLTQIKKNFRSFFRKK